MKNPSCALGKEIRDHRRLAGLSQKEVAARIGVTGAQFHRYEVGATAVTTKRLLDIADAIGVRADTLLNAATTRSPLPTMTSNTPGSMGDIASFLETFMAIRDPAHRDALMAVARMISSPVQHAPLPPAKVMAGQADLVINRSLNG